MVGDITHVCNRGVDRRKIFVSRKEYQRFRDNLYLLNNVEGKVRTKHKNIFSPDVNLPKRNQLVEVLKWSLMPNHFHLLLLELVDGGILEYVKRIGNAYTKYFNLKNNHRSGYLFQNSAKIIPIQSESYFPYIPIYIDLNPAKLVNGSPNYQLNFIKKYEWSSLKNYYGKGEDEAIINKEIFYEIFETDLIKYEKDLNHFLKNRSTLLKSFEGVNLAG